MFAEERTSKILQLIDQKGSATVQELMIEFDASESTIRRDLNSMDANGLIIKVHGGAISKNTEISTEDDLVNHRKALNYSDKAIIAKYAASLISDDDFVYIDAGTTTELIVDFITSKKTTFVTNSLDNAKNLSDKGYKVYILGGEFKSTTEAIVGEEAVVSLDKYNFTKGFWGTNGVSVTNGLTTPEVKEAMVKRKSMENCKEKYVLADSTKFSIISSVKFSEFNQVTIITTNLKNDSLKGYPNIMEV